MKFHFCQKKLRKVIALLLLSALLMLETTGCGTKEDGAMTGIRFDRGHGSSWGNQFYIEVRTDEIRKACFFPEGAQDQTVCEHIPITTQQWEALCKAVDALDLVEDRPSLWQKLWSSRKQDGGEYRTLTLIRQMASAEEEITYQWPASEQAQTLEKLLEQLAASTQTQQENPVEDVPIGHEDTYWVAETWCEHTEEEVEQIETLDPALWSVDLLIRVDGTACLRDIHERVCLTNDSCRNLTWERSAEGEFLFYSALYAQPVLRGAYEKGTLALEYWGTTLYMKQQPVPQTAGQEYLPAELTGTWLMVSGETEGYQWEAMPGALSSIVFRVTSYNGPLILTADLEKRNYYGQTEQVDYGLETVVLSQPLYEGCENEAWSVRIGAASPLDVNGYPVQTEVCATLVDRDILLVQQYYTIDGNPAVSYQTYRRFADIVSWMSPESMNLDHSNWVCTGYESAADEALPPKLEGMSVILNPDETCFVQYGDGSTQAGTWLLGDGGVLLLRGEETAEEPFWFGGVISGYWVEDSDGSMETYQMFLYCNGGILKLSLNSYG